MKRPHYKSMYYCEKEIKEDYKQTLKQILNVLKEHYGLNITESNNTRSFSKIIQIDDGKTYSAFKIDWELTEAENELSKEKI